MTRADGHPDVINYFYDRDQAVVAVKPNVSKKPKEADFAAALWSAAQSDYRSGTTFGKLSEIYSIPIALLVARKQRENWRRDLRQAVAAETLANLAVGTSESGASRELTDEQVVAAAATRGAEIVTRHRHVLATSIEALSTLAGDLKMAVAAASKGDTVAFATCARFLGPKETLAEAALKLGNALARVVPLERKAFGLDEGNDAKPFEESLREWHAQRAALRQSGG